MTEPTTIDEDLLEALGCHAAVLPLCRRLAARFAVDYPEHLEMAATAEWQHYLASRPRMGRRRG